MNKPRQLIIATRASPLALKQADIVKSKLERLHPDLEITYLATTTRGDKNQHTALSDIGGKNLFAKELQAAVLQNKADIAVHSTKDLSAKPIPGLSLVSFCEREDPRDCFISERYSSFSDLPPQATLGTASPRRQSQLLALRPDLNIKLLRGNVKTRLDKLKHAEYDAIILAAAGLNRLGLSAHICEYFSVDVITPAIGQGVIGIECRTNDRLTQALIKPLNHAPTHSCVSAERAVNAYLNGNCFTPIGAHAILKNGNLNLTAIVGALDGSTLLQSKIQGSPNDAESLGTQAALGLIKQGAKAFLQS